MSELIPDLPPAPPAPPPRDATAIVLVRARAGRREVFWVQRGKALAFFAGFRAFPGGRIDEADRAVPVDGLSGEEAALRACAVRELFEETGVLLVQSAARIPLERRRELRAALLEDRLTLGGLLESERTTIDAERLVPAGRWITPDFLPLRYDARMFLVDLPAGEEAEVWPGELALGEWVEPARALERWARGETLLHPPNWNALDALRAAPTREALLERLRHPAHAPDHVAERIEFQQGFKLFPLRTPTLPPATHTSCYLLGNGELLIVDPGAPAVAEQARLFGFLDALIREGMRPVAVFLTHHHQDHVGAAHALRRRYRLPLWCHPLAAAEVGGAERLLADGEVLELAGAPPLRLEVLHTPGHARGHLCLYHRESRALVCGDMVAAESTIIIDPPEGNMADYLHSLERLRALPVGALFQAHGAPIAEGTAKLDAYLAHRRARIEALAAALEQGPRTVPELVAEVYTDVPEAIHPIAGRSALASLEFLEAEGRVRHRGEKFEKA